MRLRRMFAVLTVAASLGVGLMHIEPASASAIAPAAQAQHQSPQHPDATIRAISVDVKPRCGEFKGVLSYVAAPAGRELKVFFEVDGTLTVTCRDGKAHLRAYWTPSGFGEQTALIGNTAGTQRIEWVSPGYLGISISNMFVLVCTFDSPLGGGCHDSPKL